MAGVGRPPWARGRGRPRVGLASAHVVVVMAMALAWVSTTVVLTVGVPVAVAMAGGVRGCSVAMTMAAMAVAAAVGPWMGGSADRRLALRATVAAAARGVPPVVAIAVGVGGVGVGVAVAVAVGVAAVGVGAALGTALALALRGGRGGGDVARRHHVLLHALGHKAALEAHAAVGALLAVVVLGDLALAKHAQLFLAVALDPRLALGHRVLANHALSVCIFCLKCRKRCNDWLQR